MTDEKETIPVPLIVNQKAYLNMQRKSLEDLSGFWADRAEFLVTWFKKWDAVLEGDFNTNRIAWFAGAKLNASVSCLDRHLINGRRNKAALVWVGENTKETKTYTYKTLHSEVCRFANVLKKRGINKGDCVAIYLPMIPELVISLLACARIGAVHCVVFSGFSSATLEDRIQDCNAKALITADGFNRAGKKILLKLNADDALEESDHVESCIVVRRTKRNVSMKPGRDSWWHDEIRAPDIADQCEPVAMDSDDTLFVLYTSGSTGKPKKVVHSTGGYLTYVLHTSQVVFDITDKDIFWCTADIGWITGHSYIVYGPLGLGATTLMYEGTPLYPGPERYWEIVEKFRVNIFYTAPTVIRALMGFGPAPVQKHVISSLRLLGSVGEPINPETWNWYNEIIGKGRLSIVDTWFQTETGGIMISPPAQAATSKQGTAAFPLPGIDAVIIDEEGKQMGPDQQGRLVVRTPWPGMLKNFSTVHHSYPGVFDTGDGARVDKEGYFRIIGRLDDVINVSGHRLGTVEIESTLLTHKSIAESAVVGKPHPLKGQAVYAYVVLKKNRQPTPELFKELRLQVHRKIGAIAVPDTIQVASALPKTRSGKIMRRILRKIAADDVSNLGDVSSIADYSVLADLIEEKTLSAKLHIDISAGVLNRNCPMPFCYNEYLTT
ncbi:MAG: acetate--CoA ligase [Desulfobulbaceae bacterium]|nr:acetate--CoA ligase [Desulfobulbaceae bacterium]